MLVRSNTMVFIGGRRLRVDPVSGLTEAFEVAHEDGKPLPKHLHPADGSAPVRAAGVPGQANAPAKPGHLTKKEIMAQLSAAGIKYNATMSGAALLELLNKAKGAAAPAASTAPPKDPAGGSDPAPPSPSAPAGSGDQDVI